jgi:archaellum component FlaC
VTDGPDNLVLQLLQRIDARFTVMAEDLGECKDRVTSIEASMATLDRGLDRVENRLDRIEVRLGLVEA